MAFLSLFSRLVVLTLSLSAIWSGAAWADPSSPPAGEIAGVFGEGAEPHVDTKTGAFVWSYPFDLPKTRGKLQPLLGLNYSSQRGDGYVGYGWDLSLPAIERTVLAGNPCFAKDGVTPLDCRDRNIFGDHRSLERYAYGGRPLILICEIGAPADDGNCGEEPLPRWAVKGWRYFRLQVEGEFLRFFLSPDRLWWRVQIKGGMVAEYGAPPDFPWPATESSFDHPEGILRWRLVEQRDTPSESGKAENIIIYRWQDLGKRRLLFLTDVYDTPGVPFTGKPKDFAHHVQFDWTKPAYPLTAYAQGWRATPDLLLSRVVVTSADWERAKPRQVVRSYSMAYQARQREKSLVPGQQVFYPWNRSFLSQIQVSGTCRAYENDQGVVPPELPCEAPAHSLPPTVFEYENGFPGFELAKETVINAAPDGVSGSAKVLPWLRSVGIVDFNGDGLPDIVQGWNSELCPGAHAIPDTISVSSFDDSLECTYQTEHGPVLRSIASARPVIGYINRGNEYDAQFDYTCMDAGTRLDPLGLTANNQGRRPGFFSDRGAVTAVGLWSTGSLIWSQAKYAPFRAVPQRDVSPSGSGCGPDNFSERDFHPAWVWQKTQTQIDWAKSANDLKPVVPLWLTDVDGDGLVDRLGDGGDRAGDFNSARVEFTRRYGPEQHSSFGGDGPIQVPFDWDGDPAESIAPSPEARADTRFFYQDINGDGFPDAITVNPRDNAGSPRVRPGDGQGHFTCVTAAQPQWP